MEATKSGAKRTLVRIQDKGQITLPAALRRKLGLRTGDLVAVEETADGVLLRPQRAVPASVLEAAGKTLAEQGISLAHIRSWAEAAQTPEGIRLRDYTPEELQQFLVDDVLTEEQLAIVKRFVPDEPAR